MNFSNIARQLSEENPALSVERASGEAALAGGEKQKNDTQERKQKQKAQMAQQGSTPSKSDVSYASEEYKLEREQVSQMDKRASNWRAELNEAMGPDDGGSHPFVDVMPFVDQKQMEAKRQYKAAAKMTGLEGGKQAKMAAEGALNPFQVHFDQDGKPYRSKGSKKDRERIAKNISSNRKSGPMAQDPYKPRRGESD